MQLSNYPITQDDEHTALHPRPRILRWARNTNAGGNLDQKRNGSRRRPANYLACDADLFQLRPSPFYYHAGWLWGRPSKTIFLEL